MRGGGTIIINKNKWKWIIIKILVHTNEIWSSIIKMIIIIEEEMRHSVRRNLRNNKN